MRQKPNHVYIGRESCGCCTALVNDEGNKFTAQAVAEFIESGRSIERVAWQYYVDVISNEKTFMNCPHVPEPEPELQPALFAGVRQINDFIVD